MKHDMSHSGRCAACGYTYEEICDDIGPADCPGHRLKAVESFDEIRANRDRIKREERAASVNRALPIAGITMKDAFAGTIYGGDPADFPVNRGSGGAFVAWPVYEAADEPDDDSALT